MATLIKRLGLAARILRGSISEDAIAGLLVPATRTNPPQRGITSLLDAYASMPWFRVALDKVSSAVASVRWRLFAVRPQGEERFIRPLGLQRAAYRERLKLLHEHQLRGEVVELIEHPLLDLLHRSNPWLTGYEQRKLTQIYLDAVGEVGWLKERNGAGVPIAVWPVPPHWIQDLPTANRPTFVLGVDRRSFEVPMTEMIWFRHAHPLNPFGRGVGIGAALGDELETDEYAARHLKQWFYNSARPDLVVTLEGASEPELRRAEQAWLQRHQGFWRAFKPYFVNRSVEVREIGQTFRDMQLTQIRSQERDIILQTFGLPPEIMGILESSNRATIESADFLMAKHVTIPRLEFLREVLQERLVPEYDERIVIDYESPLEEDRDFILRAASAQPATLTVDEWRRLQGAPPLPDGAGQVFLTPLNVMSTTRPGGGPVATPPQGEEQREEEQDEVEMAEEAALPGPRKLLSLGASSGDGELLIGVVRDPVSPDEFFATVHRIADKMAPRWRKALLEIMAELPKHLRTAELEAALRTGNVEAVARLLPRDLVERTIGSSPLPGLLRATVSAAGHAAARDLSRAVGISIGFGELNPRAVEWIQRHTGRLISEVSEETVLAVRGIIERSFREALAPRQAAKLIREIVGLHSRQAIAVANFRSELLDAGIAEDVVDKRVARYADALRRQRAMMIARTETIAAANGGQQLLWEQAAQQGLLDKSKVRRVWLVTPDDRLDTRVCEPIPHLEENQNVKLDQPFRTGTGELVMTPPAHPNCRCAVALRFKR